MLDELERQFVETLERYAEGASREPELKDLYDRMAKMALSVVEDRRKEILRCYFPSMETRLERVNAEIAKIRSDRRSAEVVLPDERDEAHEKESQNRMEGEEP